MTKKVPEGWQKIINSEAFQLNKGTVFKEFFEEPTDGLMPYLLIEAFNGAPDKYVHPGKATVCTSSDPLLVMDGSRSGLVLKGRNGVVGSTLAVAIPKDKKALSKDYLYYHLSSLYAFLNQSKTAGAVPHVDRQRLMDLPFLMPPHIEQEKITEIMGSVDEAIRTTKEVIEKTRSVKRALTQSLLTKGIPGRHKKFKDSPLGKIPEEWKVCKLEELGDMKAGFTINKDRIPDKNPRPYLRVANVRNGFFDLSEISFLEASDAELQNRIISKGDLLIVEGHANIKELGRACVATDAVVGLTHQNHLHRFIPNLAKALPDFIALSLATKNSRQIIEPNGGTSSGLHTLSRKNLLSIPVLLPMLDEQRAIVRATQNLCDAIKKGEDFLCSLEGAKSALMSSLLSGRIRVPVSPKQKRKGAA